MNRGNAPATPLRRAPRSRAARLMVATVLAAPLSTACSEPTATPVAEGGLLDMQADNVIYGMASYITKEGVREGRIEADTAYLFVDSTKYELRSMTIVFYDEYGRPRATVTGREGEWQQALDRMVARGDVVLEVHTDGRVVKSQELYYDASRDRIWSDSATTMTLADGTLTRGSSFESDLEFRNMEIRDIRGGARPIS